jgi:hypothetical protein
VSTTFAHDTKALRNFSHENTLIIFTSQPHPDTEMSLGITYAKSFNDQLGRCNRESMTKNELLLLAQIDSADHICTLLAYGQCSVCKSFMSLRYGRFCIISIDNLLFDYMSELRAASSVANAFISSHNVHIPELVKPGNPQRLSKRDMDLQSLNDITRKAIENPERTTKCEREHLTDHTCPPCSKEHTDQHTCPECPRSHLDNHVCQKCTKEHLDQHKCKPCTDKHLRDHKCPPCKLKHLSEHNCPKCTEPHLKDHTCNQCTKSHLEDHKCKPCTKNHLETHKCPTCKEPHLKDHLCPTPPPCGELHLNDHHCPPCTRPHLEQFPAFTSPMASYSTQTWERTDDSESVTTTTSNPKLRRSKHADLSSDTIDRPRPVTTAAPPTEELNSSYERKHLPPPVEAPEDQPHSSRGRSQYQPGEYRSHRQRDYDEESYTSSTRRHHRREESVQPSRHHRRASSKAPPPPSSAKNLGFLGNLALASQRKTSRREDPPPSPSDERKHRRHDSHSTNY